MIFRDGCPGGESSEQVGALGKYDGSMENDGDEIKTRAKPTGTEHVFDG
jgi:hypothetical protein